MDVESEVPRGGVGLPPGPIVTLRYRVPPERRAALLTFLSEAIPLYESPGGIAVGLWENLDEEGAYLELVAYATAEGFQADQARVEEHPRWKLALARWREIVGGAIEVGLMRRVPVSRIAAAPEPGRQAFHLVPATVESITRVWTLRWGIPVVTPSGIYRPADVTGVMLEGPAGEAAGLVTWVVRNAEAELISVDTLELGRGQGPRLLSAAEDQLRARGVATVRLVTSNDNIRAAGFYQACGYRMVRLHLGAVDAIRRIKPGVPETGHAGVSLKDLWEFEKTI